MPHESGVMPLRLRLGAESIAVKVPARLSARRIWGCLILFFSAVAGGGVWLSCFFFCFFCSFRLPEAWSVAFFSFLTTSVDAPGEQSTSFRVREHLSQVPCVRGVRAPERDTLGCLPFYTNFGLLPF